MFGAVFSHRVERLIHATVGVFLLLAIAGSLSFCFVSAMSVHNEMPEMNQTQTQSSFATHLAHVKALGSTVVSEQSVLAVVALILISISLFVGAFLLLRSLMVLLQSAIPLRRYERSDRTPSDIFFHTWLAFFVRSPQCVRPA